MNTSSGSWKLIVVGQCDLLIICTFRYLFYSFTYWECGMLLGVCNGVNVLSKQVGPLVDGDVFAC